MTCRLAGLVVDVDQESSHGSDVVADGGEGLGKEIAPGAGAGWAVRHGPLLMCGYLSARVVFR